MERRYTHTHKKKNAAVGLLLPMLGFVILAQQIGFGRFEELTQGWGGSSSREMLMQLGQILIPTAPGINNPTLALVPFWTLSVCGAWMHLTLQKKTVKDNKWRPRTCSMPTNVDPGQGFVSFPVMPAKTGHQFGSGRAWWAAKSDRLRHQCFVQLVKHCSYTVASRICLLSAPKQLFQKLKNLMRPYSVEFQSPLELSAQGGCWHHITRNVLGRANPWPV